jgi:cytochrome d ubiquinol oxidase subunit II
METVWFILVAVMVIAYAVLDGFDLGAGAVHFLVAKTEGERATVLKAIGPVWDGNEVWLVAAGGTIFFAFPRLYASSFSGFYLPLMIVLWLLILRGVGAELRGHVDDPLWRSLFDFVFSAASLLLTLFFGVAIGNIVRGVPLGADGYFFAPLWTDFRAGAHPGVIDWYTIVTGALAVVALTAHGAHWVALKTTGDVAVRARQVAAGGWRVLVPVSVVALGASLYVRPDALNNFSAHPWGWTIPVCVVAALAAMPLCHARQRDAAAFTASAVYLVGTIAGAAFALYPVVLPASGDPAYSLTIDNTKTGAYSLRVGLVWWTVGMTLAVGYFALIYRLFRGKVPADAEGGYDDEKGQT